MSPRHLILDTPLGRYVLAADASARPEGADALVGLWREEQSHFPADARLGEVAAGPDALLDDAATQVLAYLAGELDTFDLPLAPAGTAFQHAVWDAIARIPRGATTTYGTIARELGAPRASQAVGAAVGRNPLSIIVPCHRVLASNGALTGYAGGIDTKVALLRLEGATVPTGDELVGR